MAGSYDLIVAGRFSPPPCGDRCIIGWLPFFAGVWRIFLLQRLRFCARCPVGTGRSALYAASFSVRRML